MLYAYYIHEEKYPEPILITFVKLRFNMYISFRTSLMITTFISLFSLFSMSWNSFC